MKTKATHTKTTKIKAVIGTFATLTAVVVISMTAAPAMAGPAHLDSSVLDDLLSMPGGLERLDGLLDSHLLFEMLPAFDEDLLPEGPFPDGGGEEDVPADDVGDAGDAGDEAAPDGGDEACDEPGDETADDAGDEACEEEPDGDAEETPADEGILDSATDEATDEPTDEPTTAVTDEEPRLPYTGGDSLPWLIGGVGVILAGAILLLCLRGRTQTH